MSNPDYRRTKTRGRPPKPGRGVRVTIRLHEADHGEIIARLEQIPAGQRSAYIRRVLAGAPVQVLDRAIEDDTLTNDLNAMWDDEDEWTQ